MVHQDPRIPILAEKHAQSNAALKKAAARTARGYRIMVISTNKRDEAIAAKTRIYTNFPELKAYLIYQAPYFKLKTGNFRTQEEAAPYLRSLGSMFPKGVFIMNDTIEITPEKASEE